MRHISSLLIHGSGETSSTPHRSLKTPIYETASFDFESAEDAEKSFMGLNDSHAYSRISNPTVTELQERLKLFSGAEQVLCVASGMAAISNVFITLCKSGDNIITSRYLFGNTYSFFARTLNSFGIEARFTDFENLEVLEKNIDGNTRAIFVELPTNPQLILFDIEGIAKIAKEKNVVLVVDNTVLTPYLFPCSEHGVDIEIFSNTKFVSGGATSIGGSILVYKSDKWTANPKLQPEVEKFGTDAFFKDFSKRFIATLVPVCHPTMPTCNSWDLKQLHLGLTRLLTIAPKWHNTCWNIQRSKQLSMQPCPMIRTMREHSSLQEEDRVVWWAWNCRTGSNASVL